MKTLPVFILVLAAALYSCSPAQQAAQGNSMTPRGDTTYVQNPQTLADVLIREPGVNFESGQITIRGQSYPLFMVDGVPVGRTYGEVASAVVIQDIQSVEVLKSASETSIYGRQGANGVILITTR